MIKLRFFHGSFVLLAVAGSLIQPSPAWSGCGSSKVSDQEEGPLRHGFVPEDEDCPAILPDYESRPRLIMPAQPAVAAALPIRVPRVKNTGKMEKIAEESMVESEIDEDGEYPESVAELTQSIAQLPDVLKNNLLDMNPSYPTTCHPTSNQLVLSEHPLTGEQ
jgi:hypothetical protein